MNTPVAFILIPSSYPEEDTVVTAVYVEAAGRHYRFGRMRGPYRDYVAFAQRMGIEVVAEADLPVTNGRSGALAEEITADAEAAFGEIRLRHGEYDKVEVFNRGHEPGHEVRYRLNPEGKPYTGRLAGRAHIIGGQAAVWIVGLASPIDLDLVTDPAAPQ